MSENKVVERSQLCEWLNFQMQIATEEAECLLNEFSATRLSPVTSWILIPAMRLNIKLAFKTSARLCQPVSTPHLQPLPFRKIQFTALLKLWNIAGAIFRKCYNMNSNYWNRLPYPRKKDFLLLLPSSLIHVRITLLRTASSRIGKMGEKYMSKGLADDVLPIM